MSDSETTEVIDQEMEIIFPDNSEPLSENLDGNHEKPNEGEPKPTDEKDKPEFSKNPIDYVVDKYGGQPEEWKSTYQGTAEGGGKFDGEQILDQDGKSIIEQLRNTTDMNSADKEKAIGFQEKMLEDFHNGEKASTLDYTEKIEGGIKMSVIVAVLDGEGRIAYATYSKEEKEEDKEINIEGNVILPIEQEITANETLEVSKDTIVDAEQVTEGQAVVENSAEVVAPVDTNHVDAVAAPVSSVITAEPIQSNIEAREHLAQDRVVEIVEESVGDKTGEKGTQKSELAEIIPEKHLVITPIEQKITNVVEPTTVIDASHTKNEIHTVPTEKDTKIAEQTNKEPDKIIHVEEIKIVNASPKAEVAEPVAKIDSDKEQVVYQQEIHKVLESKVKELLGWEGKEPKDAIIAVDAQAKLADIKVEANPLDVVASVVSSEIQPPEIQVSATQPEKVAAPDIINIIEAQQIIHTEPTALNVTATEQKDVKENVELSSKVSEAREVAETREAIQPIIIDKVIVDKVSDKDARVVSERVKVADNNPKTEIRETGIKIDLGKIDKVQPIEKVEVKREEQKVNLSQDSKMLDKETSRLVTQQETRKPTNIEIIARFFGSRVERQMNIVETNTVIRGLGATDTNNSISFVNNEDQNTNAARKSLPIIGSRDGINLRLAV